MVALQQVQHDVLGGIQMNKSALVWAIVLVVVPLGLFVGEKLTGGITGAVVSDKGCCVSTCKDVVQEQCEGAFVKDECNAIDECNIGCCLDPEGYCLGNYIFAQCVAGRGKFLSGKECFEEPRCIWARPAGSFLGALGYPVVYPASQKGVVFIEPFAGTVGQPFGIKFEAFEKEKVKVADAQIQSRDYVEKFRLYDDGSHGDGNAKDGVFGAVWDSAPLRGSFNGIRVVNVTGFVNGVESVPGDYLLLASARCVPFVKNWAEGRRELAFVGASGGDPASTFEGDIEFLVKQINDVPLLSAGFWDTNVYAIPEQLLEGDKGAARTKVAEQCGFYDAGQDFTVFLDPTFPYCEQDGDLIHTHGKAFLNVTLEEERVPFEMFMKDFCEHTSTVWEIADTVVEVVSAPNVSIISPVASPPEPVRSGSEENIISFIADDNKDKNISYEIYADIKHGLQLLNYGEAVRGEVTTVPVNLTDGAHFVWIEVTDSDDNFGRSGFLSVTVNVSNFVVQILSLNVSIEYERSPDVEFTVSHAADKEVKYTLFVDGESELTSMTSTNFKTVVKTDMANGTHTIEIAAEDLAKKVAYSLPYDITIGTLPAVVENEE